METFSSGMLRRSSLKCSCLVDGFGKRVRADIGKLGAIEQDDESASAIGLQQSGHLTRLACAEAYGAGTPVWSGIAEHRLLADDLAISGEAR